MWSVSSAFLAALRAAPVFQSVMTYTVPGGSPVALKIESGSVTCDASQPVRRQGTITATGDSTVYEQVSIPGTIFDIQHGLKHDGITELVPVFHGEATSPAQDLGGETVQLTLGDMTNRVQGAAFVTPFTPAVNLTATTVIANQILAAVPGTVIKNTSTNKQIAPTSMSWSTNPVDVITDLCNDCVLEAFFMPDGTYMIRDMPLLDSAPVWTTNLLTSATRTRPMDQMYNTVVVQPGATDGSQTWAQQVATITDTNSPLHPSKIGPRVYIYESQLATTAAQALNIAYSILSKFSGSSQSLALGAIVNPAIECSDIFTAIVAGVNNEPPQSFKHFIDNFSLDLATGEMTLNSRTTQLSDNPAS